MIKFLLRVFAHRYFHEFPSEEKILFALFFFCGDTFCGMGDTFLLNLLFKSHFSFFAYVWLLATKIACFFKFFIRFTSLFVEILLCHRGHNYPFFACIFDCLQQRLFVFVTKQLVGFCLSKLRFQNSITWIVSLFSVLVDFLLSECVCL